MTQLENNQSFCFMGLNVLVQSNSCELIKRISLDFSHFLIGNKMGEPFLKINSYLDEVTFQIPSWPEIRRSKNSITYEREKVRVNDYHGKLISKFDYEKEQGELYSNSIEKLHEITYLLILSRVGKFFDLKGIHKIHALGAVYKETCLVGMMNMGVGKSTLLLELLKDPEVLLLSDDTPLVNQDGLVSKFPIRIGLEKFSNDLEIKNPEENIYSLEREHYGKKTLISIAGIKNDLGKDYKRLILFEGRRSSTGVASLKKIGKFSIWLSLQKHMVIGIGLPLIFEYFWESGPIDFYRKTKIFYLRQVAAIRLLNKSEHFIFYMGKNPSENARVLKSLC